MPQALNYIEIVKEIDLTYWKAGYDGNAYVRFGTASGYSVWTNGMKLVAADTSVLPFGSLVSVPGYDDDSVVPVLDRGGAIKGNRLDVLYATHEQAQRWGRQTLQVTVWEYADGKGSDFEPRYHRASSVVARR
jgi:3D (Asp-Asp-Asp) domain-containing protein